MKALTKPEKFQALSRIYGYELPDDIMGYECVVVDETYDEWGNLIDQELDCLGVCAEIFDCDDC